MGDVARLMPHVETLHIGGPIGHADLSPIARMERLRELRINAHVPDGDVNRPSEEEARAFIQTQLTHAQGARGLRLLRLENEMRLSPADTRQFAKLQQLTSLYLSNAEIDNDGLEFIGQLQNLEFLSFRGPAMDARGLRHLAKLQRLRSLHIGRTNAARRDLRELLACRSLERLTWNGISIRGRDKIEDGLKNDE
jgi:hypothetical protein